ncbi:MAG: hypothetical protein ABWZ15_07765 [Acidimicrobiia bacterium]
MFRRALALATAVTALGAASFVSAAGAAAPNRTTITITCDRATTSAVAVVTMYDAIGGTPVGDPTTVACGTDPGFAKRARVVVEHLSSVAAASIGGYDVTSNSQTVTCEGAGTLTFELACTGPTGAGAKVTVR